MSSCQSVFKIKYIGIRKTLKGFAAFFVALLVVAAGIMLYSVPFTAKEIVPPSMPKALRAET